MPQVFRAAKKTDLKHVASLLQDKRPLRARKKTVYYIARLDTQRALSLKEPLLRVNKRGAHTADGVGPIVGYLEANYSSTVIPSKIYDFADPEEIEDIPVEERVGLWGMKVTPPPLPHHDDPAETCRHCALRRTLHSYM